MNSGWDLGTIKKVHTRLPDRVFYQCWGKLTQLINAPEEIDPSPHVCRTIVCTMPCDRLAAISLSLSLSLSPPSDAHHKPVIAIPGHGLLPLSVFSLAGKASMSKVIFHFSQYVEVL